MHPAYAIHALTATGAVLSLGALHAAAQSDWRVMILWLIGALAVDAIDGPLARRFKVTKRAPQIDGVLLDLIIDFLTYVFIPAYAMALSGMLPDLWAWPLAGAVVFGSALYFSKSGMKTATHGFRGFPACWNMVVLTLLALNPAPWVAALIVAILVPAMFAPLEFIHPVRTRALRWLSLPVAIVWAGLTAFHALSGATLSAGFSLTLALAGGYLLSIGAILQARRRQ